MPVEEEYSALKQKFPGSISEIASFSKTSRSATPLSMAVCLIPSMISISFSEVATISLPQYTEYQILCNSHKEPFSFDTKLSLKTSSRIINSCVYYFTVSAAGFLSECVMSSIKKTSAYSSETFSAIGKSYRYRLLFMVISGIHFSP